MKAEITGGQLRAKEEKIAKQIAELEKQLADIDRQLVEAGPSGEAEPV